MLRNMAHEFPGARGYLNTASMGLPPGIAADELRTAIDTWQRGRASAPEYDACIDEARALFAELVNVSPDSVAIWESMWEPMPSFIRQAGQSCPAAPALDPHTGHLPDSTELL